MSREALLSLLFFLLLHFCCHLNMQAGVQQDSQHCIIVVMSICRLACSNNLVTSLLLSVQYAGWLAVGLLLSARYAGWLAVGHCLGRMQADLQLCCAHAALDIFRQAPALPSEGFDALQPHLTASTWLTCHRLTSAVALYCLSNLQDE